MPSLPAPTGPRFSCDVRPERDVVIVVPAGELDIATVGIVDAELRTLRDAGFDHLAVDLRRLAFLDSSGLHLLLRWTRSTGRRGTRFSVIAGPPRIQRVLELANVDGAIDLVSETELIG